MKRAQPLVMMTIWKSHSCLCQPVPSSGGISGLALTRWQITCPPVAAAMPRSRYRKKSRKPPPVNSVSPGLTWENLLTTACWFIRASTVFVHAIATAPERPIFWQRRIAAFTASLCYAKITPAALHRGEFDDHCRKQPEALGRKPEFETSD